MAFQNLTRDLIFACHLGELGMAQAAIEAGALADQADIQSLNAFQACLKGPKPEMAIDIQLYAERASGERPWRGRDGQNGASYIAMSASGALMAQAIERLPHAIFERDREGQTPWDLFCQSCCAQGIHDENVERAARLAMARCSPEDLESSLASCRVGHEIAESLGRTSSGSNAILSLLEAKSIEISLRGSGMEPEERPSGNSKRI